MASEKQIKANRANAQLSTGPRTEAGKEIVRHNACTHGILSNELVLKGEDKTKLYELRSNLMEECDPNGEMETFQVEIILDCIWKLKRIQRVEYCLLSQSLPEVHENMRATNWAFEMNGSFRGRWDLLQRYQTLVDRRMYKARQELEKMQHSRITKIAVSKPSSLNADVTPNGLIAEEPLDLPQSIDCGANSPAIIMGFAKASLDSAATSFSPTSGMIITSSNGITITGGIPKVSRNITGNSSSTTDSVMMANSSNRPYASVVATGSGMMAWIEVGYSDTSTLPTHTKVENSMGT